MAEPKTPAKGKENVFTRKLGPLPAWVWMAIAAALILLWVVWSGHKKASSTATGGQKTGGFGAELVPPVILHGARGPRGRRGRPGNSGGEEGEKGEGPEREWLENKTGSEHPWSFLARHHERIVVGPKGSHKIIGGRKGRDKRSGDEDKASHPRPVRGAPGAAAGAVPGQLVSFTVPASGPTPSLAQVAQQYNTSPDAIVEEATGRGNPHGALWRRYVANNDWQAPLPAGTDMTILSPAS